ncbi:hypothetical protein M409DRAFT_16784 [Zasmidium cellare ATCC 36951]|uniref:Uncharacterized protein n=1 Tax=Zasmidium cellare ATCC 36951 TaxID=1080233 RepID=A0A6A6D028_ZASCE|nr:uncharacterized protein M409DRAFT_16784 [Zasmidium cellare ATCC 36951]KAF2172827.1 hypothetical protein M409DRAFT_16784 [Zasmidium cellare ATCC 36951]
MSFAFPKTQIFGDGTRFHLADHLIPVPEVVFPADWNSPSAVDKSTALEKQQLAATQANAAEGEAEAVEMMAVDEKENVVPVVPAKRSLEDDDDEEEEKKEKPKKKAKTAKAAKTEKKQTVTKAAAMPQARPKKTGSALAALRARQAQK